MQTLKECAQIIIEHPVYTQFTKGQERFSGIVGELQESGFLPEDCNLDFQELNTAEDIVIFVQGHDEK